MVKKVMKWILIGIVALIGLVIVGVTLLVAISNYKGANYWKFAKPQGMIETEYTGIFRFYHPLWFCKLPVVRTFIV